MRAPAHGVPPRPHCKLGTVQALCRDACPQPLAQRATPLRLALHDLQEGTAFLTPNTESIMVVDKSAHGDLLRVNFNVSFPALPCEFASLDISDSLGTVRAASGKHTC